MSSFLPFENDSIQTSLAQDMVDKISSYLQSLKNCVGANESDRTNKKNKNPSSNQRIEINPCIELRQLLMQFDLIFCSISSTSVSKYCSPVLHEA